MEAFEPTVREREILYGYSNGLSDGEIAKVLDLKPGNVMTIGCRMRAKMGARNRAHAVMIAARLGILDGGAP